MAERPGETDLVRKIRAACLNSPKRFPTADEVAGQLIALIGAPLHWKSMIAAFILFRAFDILKPFPLRRLERLPEGIGIMFDDVGAGLYALAIMQALLHFGILR